MNLAANASTVNQSLDAIRKTYREHLRLRDEKKIAERDDNVAKLISSQILETAHPQHGGWGDVTDSSTPALCWEMSSLCKLTHMSEAWGEEKSRYFQDKELANRIELAAKFYVTVLKPTEPFPGNWWFWQIGAPRDLGHIFIFAAEAISSQTHAKLLDAFKHIVDHIWDFHASANRMSVTISLFEFALAANSASHMVTVKNWAEESCKLVEHIRDNPQGFRLDGSYFYHGARVNLAYGHGHFIEMAHLTCLLASSPWAITGPGVENVQRTMLDFVQWTLCNNMVDPFVCDRGIASPGLAEGTRNMADAFLATGLYLLEANAPRREELEQYCVRLMQQGAKPKNSFTKKIAEKISLKQAPPLSGVHYFQDAEYLAARRPTWSVSIKMATAKTITYAGINRLNRKGWHISDSQLILRTTGEELDDSVTTTMDWDRLSGITRADGFRIPHETPGHSWFATGASSTDGLTGCCGLDFCIRRPDDQCEIAARKNWFILEDAIVATGSNIWTTSTEKMETIIRHIALPAAQENEKFEEGEFETEFLVGHDCVYILPQKPKVKVYTQWREGNFAEIGDAKHADKKFRRRYWTALLTHAAGPHPCWGDPKTDGQYVIVYLPKMSLEAAKKWWSQKPFEITQQNVLAHRLIDRRRNLTMTVTQWRGATVV